MGSAPRKIAPNESSDSNANRSNFSIQSSQKDQSKPNSDTHIEDMKHDLHTTVSNRTQTMMKDPSPLLYYKSCVQANEYHEKFNPTGICNLGVAENHLCENELVEKLQSIQTWSSQFHYYPDSCGDYAFRQRLCSFFHERFCSPEVELDPHRMIITSGVSGSISLLSFLIADIGDVFLIASPCYTAFDFDVAAMAGNALFKCPLLDQDTGKFRFSVEIFQQGYKLAVAQGLRPRAMIIVNPHNPTGDVYTRKIIQPMLEFAAEKNMHVIVDEIYALSIFQGQKPFESILNYAELPDPSRTHFLWSFSKDFALSGTRIGVIYTGTRETCKNGSKFNFLMVPSSSIQHTLKSILDDRDWTNAYIQLNQSRLKNKYQKVKQQIEEIDTKIRVRNCPSGLFLWIDFRSLLHRITFDEESKLFKMIFDHGVYMTNGWTFGCSEPGWFRLVFTVSDACISEGISRLTLALRAYRKSSA